MKFKNVEVCHKKITGSCFNQLHGKEVIAAVENTHTTVNFNMNKVAPVSFLSSIGLPGSYCLQMSYQQTTQPLLPSKHAAWPSWFQSHLLEEIYCVSEDAVSRFWCFCIWFQGHPVFNEGKGSIKVLKGLSSLVHLFEKMSHFHTKAKTIYLKCTWIPFLSPNRQNLKKLQNTHQVSR